MNTITPYFSPYIGEEQLIKGGQDFIDKEPTRAIHLIVSYFHKMDNTMKAVARKLSVANNFKLRETQQYPFD